MEDDHTALFSLLSFDVHCSSIGMIGWCKRTSGKKLIQHLFLDNDDAWDKSECPSLSQLEQFMSHDGQMNFQFRFVSFRDSSCVKMRQKEKTLIRKIRISDRFSASNVKTRACSIDHHDRMSDLIEIIRRILSRAIVQLKRSRSLNPMKCFILLMKYRCTCVWMYISISLYIYNDIWRTFLFSFTVIEHADFLFIAIVLIKWNSPLEIELTEAKNI